jgi:hypothetical protein
LVLAETQFDGEALGLSGLATVEPKMPQRVVRLHGLKTADDIHDAAQALIAADWLRDPPMIPGKRPRMAYPVNPKVMEIAHGPVG